MDEYIKILEPNMWAAANPPQKPGLSPHPPKNLHIDNLFWCCYVVEYGIDEYFFVKSSHSRDTQKVELDFRISMVEKIGKDPAKIKKSNQKISKVLTEEIKSNFMTGGKLGLVDFATCCIYAGAAGGGARARIIYDDIIYIDIVPDIYEKSYTFCYNSATKKYSLWKGEEIEVSNKIPIVQYNKLLRGFSSYKTEELKNMFTILFAGTDATEGGAKKELYEKILHRIAEIVYMK